MNLGTRFFILMGMLLVAFTAVIGYYSEHLVTQINELWGAQFAEKQVLFDKHRALLPLMQEIRLARQMAADPALLEMALHENDAAIRQRGLDVLERYRLGFQDQSYFFALAGSGHYYFNDANNTYAGQQLRYTLSAKNPNDRWFYATLASNLEYQVNVDPDVHLGNTKVWINVALRHNNRTIGVIGSGLDITRFINQFVDTEQPGTRNLFVDRDLAIQLYRDLDLIDYASITKSVKQRKKVDALLSDPADVEHLREVMRRLEKTPDQVDTLWVTVEGKKYLLGVVYLPEIGWFNLTLMSNEALALLDNLNVMPILVLMFLLALVVVGLVLHRWVLQPIFRIGKAVEQVQQGNYEIDLPLVGSGEIARLSAQFRAMVAVVRNTNNELERKVAERTGQLSRELAERKHAEEKVRRLAYYDPLTQLPNRRMLSDRMTQVMAACKRRRRYAAMMLLDMDNFKDLNDTYGHAVGDKLLVEVAARLRRCVREADTVARFGGDEFEVMLSELAETSAESARQASFVAEKICASLAAPYQLTITHEDNRESVIEYHCGSSIGVALFNNQEVSEDELFRRADVAMYRAKAAGGNQVRFHETAA